MSLKKMYSHKYLLTNLSNSFNVDFRVLQTMKYEIDMHITYYGGHFRHPYEGVQKDCNDSDKQAEELLDKFFELSNILKTSLNLVDHAHVQQNDKPIIVCNAYHAWNEELEKNGWQVYSPIWDKVNSDNHIELLIHHQCQIIKKLFKSSFQVLMDRRFHSALHDIEEILKIFYSHGAIKALLIPYSLPFFEKIAVRIFRDLNKKSFLAIHGISANYNNWTENEPVDFYITWGQQIKRLLVADGCPRNKVLVAGHPSYQAFQFQDLRFDMKDILVITKSMAGATCGYDPLYTNRADSLCYLYRLQSVLEDLGVKHARVRPHPSESDAWYQEFINGGFYSIDKIPLDQSLGRSTLVIGPASTMLIDSICNGVNYIVFELDGNVIPDFYQETYRTGPPYDGSDPKIPVASNEHELENILRNKRKIDISCINDYISSPFDTSVIDRALGLEVKALSRKRSITVLPQRQVSPDDQRIINLVRPFTMTSPERILNVLRAIEHTEENHVTGCFVECGVWRGGSSMAAALSLMQRGSMNRDIYLYDTFDGMSDPSEVDVAAETGQAASVLLKQHTKDKDSLYWAYAALEDVKNNMYSTGYPDVLIHFIQGKVEDTIPQVLPRQIAILRLDTDWYESTKHELEHLYPRLVPGGVLILDDYGFWKGARKAVDEFFSMIDPKVEFNWIDDTGIYCIKP